MNMLRLLHELLVVCDISFYFLSLFNSHSIKTFISKMILCLHVSRIQTKRFKNSVKMLKRLSFATKKERMLNLNLEEEEEDVYICTV